jgi:hypothetical protein
MPLVSSGRESKMAMEVSHIAYLIPNSSCLVMLLALVTGISLFKGMVGQAETAWSLPALNTWRLWRGILSSSHSGFRAKYETGKPKFDFSCDQIS